MMFAKTLVVVDDDVDVRDEQAVLLAVASNVNPARDVLFDQGPFDSTQLPSPQCNTLRACLYGNSPHRLL
jgi:4-hydroxy-3-polyprenylbenzoate decarboxylase